MEFAPISYTKLPKTSALFLDYIYHYDRVAQFYNGSPFDASSYRKLQSEIRYNVGDRARLAEILTRQNQEFGCGDATFANINRLKEPTTFAVVTGQQVGLLSGPAFTLFKALTAVKLAQTLSEQGLPAVPVFWLATEDHDLEEVARTATLDAEYNLVDLKDSGKRSAPQSHVGLVNLTNEINAALSLLENALPAGESRDRLLQDLRECYQPGTFWGRAFGRFIAKVFKQWGVVLLDPLDDAVRPLSAKVYERILPKISGLREQLIVRSQVLVDAGYHAQVYVGESSTVLFVTQEGNRTALHERRGEFYLERGERASNVEISLEGGASGVHFSANALLRPFVQDTILPTISYVAGPAELAYLAQSQVLYAELGRPQPIIFPRAGFTLVDARTQRLMEKYRVSVEDVWQGEEHLRRTIAANGFAEGWSARLDETDQGLARLLERLRKDVEAIDPTLLDSLKHTEEKMRHHMDQLKGKISRAAISKSDLLGRHEQALSRFLLPRKQLQEREVSGVYFLGRAGYELLDRLFASIDTTSANHHVVAY